MAVHYITKTSDFWADGGHFVAKKIVAKKNSEVVWEKVKVEGKTDVSLPSGLKVDRIEQKDGREYLEILEGYYKGKMVSLPARNKAGIPYLTFEVLHRPSMVVRFNLANQTIHFGPNGPYSAFSGGGHDGYTPVVPGTYLLAIPAYPNPAPRAAFKTYARAFRTWFRVGIEATGSRFLHAGMVSHGCVTVRAFDYNPDSKKAPPSGFADLPHEAKRAPGLLGLPFPDKQQSVVGWDDIVKELLFCRFNDQAVGQLVVTP